MFKVGDSVKCIDGTDRNCGWSQSFFAGNSYLIEDINYKRGLVLATGGYGSYWVRGDRFAGWDPTPPPPPCTPGELILTLVQVCKYLCSKSLIRVGDTVRRKVGQNKHLSLHHYVVLAMCSNYVWIKSLTSNVVLTVDKPDLVRNELG